jgi:hypothetical protein
MEVSNGELRMNVSGIRPLSGIYGIHNVNFIENNEAVSQDLATQSSAIGDTTVKADVPERDTSKQTFSSADLVKQYDARKSYSMKGANADIRTLDVENAISAMQKDTALQQYQYFVGNKVTEAAQTNVTRAIENFEI